MRKYKDLIKEFIDKQDRIIQDLMQLNRDELKEVRNLVYEFRRYVEKKETRDGNNDEQ